MNLNELIHRKTSPVPWQEGDNIPWNEPGFSRRMLKEHLSQEHDAASRRFAIIERQVDWIHTALCSSKAGRILDLGCGPGFYSERLARLVHSCTGIDFSPASIEYATRLAQQEGLDCHYSCQDIRLAAFPDEFDLVMLIYGEFNVFKTFDAKKILEKAYAALKPGGCLLLEPHTYRMVKQIGKQTSVWYSSKGGLFSGNPHLMLKEHFWDEKSQAATIRYYVIDAADQQVTGYAQSFQAYTENEYSRLITGCGFHQVEFLPGLSASDLQEGLFTLTACK